MLVANLVQLSYGIPGMLSYFLVFWALIGVRNSLKQSFVVIFFLLAMTNMATWLNAWIYLKFVNERFFYFYYEWMSDKPVLINAQNFLVSHFNYVQNIYLFLLTFDRFAAINKITKEFKWWTNYYGYIILLIHLSVLGIHLSFRLPMSNVVRLNTTSRTVQLAKEDTDIIRTIVDANVRLGFAIATFLACSIFNILSLQILRKMKKSKATSIQRSIFLISLCIFLTQAFNVFVSSLIAVFNTLKLTPALAASYDIMPYLSDAFSIGPAVYTIIMPGLVRKFLVRKLGFALRLYSSNSQLSSTAIVKVQESTRHNTN